MTTPVRPIRIAYLCLQVTREGQASYAHVHEIVGGLTRRGCKVEVYEPSYSTGPVPGPIRRALEFWRVQRRLRKNAADVDVVYIRAHFAAYPTAMWARRRGITVVQEVNGPYDDLFLAWPWTKRFGSLFLGLARRQYQVADALIAVTRELAAWLKVESGAKEVSIVCNGANTEVFRSDLPRPEGLPERYVVFFGALTPWQGIDAILEAVAHVSWPDGVSLVIVGDGVMRPAVEAAAAIEPGIVYVGFRPYRDVPAFIANSLAGLVASRDRSGTGLSPLKSYETLACGVPVIVNDTPGQSELVRSESCGIVIPTGDIEALASAVARIAANPDEARAMGLRGRDAIVASHSWDARAADTMVVIERALGCGVNS
ncbi:MAG: glycosyltransferase family 4 protein [Coriobacteriia bacterium]